MSITFGLPPDLEQNLREKLGDLDQAVKQAALIELYREDKISQRDLGQALNLDRFEVDALLKKHNVTEDLPTLEELNRDFEKLSRLVEK